MTTKLYVCCATLALLAACAPTNSGWQANQYQDEFTGAQSCRVEFGRQQAWGYSALSFMQFYAENRGGEIRAGVHSLNSVPIAGDVQLKVGSTLYTLTAQDTPIDVAPTLPNFTGAAQQGMGKAYADTMKAMTRGMQQMSSPYRAYTGKKATALLRDIVATSGEIKFRTISVNAAASSTASFKAGPDFQKALQDCGINL